MKQFSPIAGERRAVVARMPTARTCRSVALLAVGVFLTVPGEIAWATDGTLIPPAGTVDWSNTVSWAGGIMPDSAGTAWLTNSANTLGGARILTNGALDTTINNLVNSNNNTTAGRGITLQLSNQNFTVVNTGTFGRNGFLLLKDSGVSSIIATAKFGNLVMENALGGANGFHPSITVQGGNFLWVTGTGTISAGTLTIGSALNGSLVATGRFGNLVLNSVAGVSTGQVKIANGNFLEVLNTGTLAGDSVLAIGSSIDDSTSSGISTARFNNLTMQDNALIRFGAGTFTAGPNVLSVTGQFVNGANNSIISYSPPNFRQNGMSLVFENSGTVTNNGLITNYWKNITIAGMNIRATTGNVTNTFRNNGTIVFGQVIGGLAGAVWTNSLVMNLVNAGELTITNVHNTSSGTMMVLLSGSVAATNAGTVRLISSADSIPRNGLGTIDLRISGGGFVNTSTGIISNEYFFNQSTTINKSNMITVASGAFSNAGQFVTTMSTNWLYVKADQNVNVGTNLLNSGTLAYRRADDSAGILENSGTILYNGGYLNVSVLTNTSSGVISNQGNAIAWGANNTNYNFGTIATGSGLLSNQGMMVLSSGGQLAGVFSNSASGVIAVTNGVTLLTGALLNSGNLNMLYDGTLAGGVITNLSTGVINSVSGGTLSSSVANLGIINVQPGLLTFGVLSNSNGGRINSTSSGGSIGGEIANFDGGIINATNGTLAMVGTVNNASVINIGGASTVPVTAMVNNLTMSGTGSNVFNAAGLNARGPDALIVTGAFVNTANNSILSAKGNGMRLIFNNSQVVTNNGMITNLFVNISANTFGISATTGNATNTFRNQGTIAAVGAGINTVNGRIYSVQWDMNLVNAGSIVVSNLGAALGNDHYLMQVLLNGSRAATNEMGGTISLVTTQRTTSSATIDFQVSGGGFVNRGILSAATSASNDTFVGRTHLFTVTSGAFSNAPTGQVILGANNSVSNALAIRANQIVNAGTNLITSGTLFYQNASGGVGVLENSGVLWLDGGTLRTDLITNRTTGLVRGSGTLAGAAILMNAGIVSNGVGETLVFNMTTLTNAAAGQLRNTGGTWVFAGTNVTAAGPSFINEGTSAANFKFDAAGSTLLFTNALSYSLSAPSANLGSAFASTNNNYFVANLTLANGTLDMVPATGGSAASRAFYVDTLTLQSGATALNLNGTFLYYNTIVGNTAIITGGGGTFIQLGSGGGGLVSFIQDGGTYNWNAGTSWDSGGAPGSGDFVFITNAITSATVITNRAASTTIQTLEISNSVAFTHTLILSNNTTTVGGAVLGSNAIVQIGAGSAAATFSNSALALKSGSQIVLSNGTAAALNRLVAVDSFSTEANTTITMAGAPGATNLIDFSGTGLIFTNIGTLMSQSGSNLVRVVGAANAGTVSLLGGVLAYQNGSGAAIALSNTGTILLGGGNLEVSALVNQAGGVISNNGGVSTISGVFTNLGQFVVRNGGVVTNSGAVTLTGTSTALVSGASSRWVGQSTFTMGRAQLVIDGGTVSNFGVVNMAIASGDSSSLIISNNGRFSVDSTMTVGGSATSTGIIVVADGGQLDLGQPVGGNALVVSAIAGGSGGLAVISNLNGTVTANSITIGTGNGESGSFIMTGGLAQAFTWTVGAAASVGDISTGIVVVSGGSLLATNSSSGGITLGRGGYAEMTISNTGFVAVRNFAVGGGRPVGTSVPSSALLTVNGGTNLVTLQLTIGLYSRSDFSSTGTVLVTGGGLLDAGRTSVGVDIGAGGVGYVTVTNGTMVVNQLTLGSVDAGASVLQTNGGQGTLTINNLGLVITTNNTSPVVLGGGTGAVGNVFINTGGRWAMGTNAMIVGQNGGGTLTLNGGILSNVAFKAVNALGGLVLGQNTTGTGQLTLATSFAVTNAGNAQLTVGQGGVGTLTLNAGANLNVDQLRVTNGANSVLIFNAGTLSTRTTFVTNTAVFTVGNGISTATLNLIGGEHAFNNGLRLNTNATLLATGSANLTSAFFTNTASSTVIVSNGTLTVGPDWRNNGVVNLLNGTLAGGALTNVAEVSGSGGITAPVLNQATLRATGGTLRVSGVIAGAGTNFVEAGSTLVLQGLNTFTGPTWVNGGTVIITNDNNLGATSSVLNFNNGGTLRVTNNATLAAPRSITLGSAGGTFDPTNLTTIIQGIISDTGALTKVGAGTLTLSGDNTYSGGTIHSNGWLVAGHDRGFGSGVLTMAGGTLSASGARLVSNNVTLANNSTVDTAGNSLALAGTIAGANELNKTGTGTLTFLGINTYSGATRINQGVLLLDQSSTLTNSIVNVNVNGGLMFSNATSFIIRGLAGSGNVNLTNVANQAVGLTVRGTANTLYSGVLAGTGSLTKNGNGELELTGASTYTGGTVVNAGALMVNNATGSALGSGDVTVNGGTLGGTGAIAGAVIVNATGHLAPGNSVGTQNCGSLTLNAGGFLDVEFGGSANDQFFVDNFNGLTIADGAKVNLYIENSLSAFTALGTYNLLNYYGDIGGVGASGLEVQNFALNRSYSFTEVLGTSNWVVLTVGGAGSGWVGAGGNSLWSTLGNWQTNNVPYALQAGDQLVFDGTTRTINTNDFADHTQFNGIIFNNSPAIGNFVLNGLAANTNIINLTGAVLNHSTKSQMINLDLELDGGTRTFRANGALTVNGNISESAPGYGLIKVGNGVLALNGNNSYTGTTDIRAGALRATAGVGLPSASNLKLNGGVFESAGTFSRNTGVVAGAVHWGSSGGFSAHGGTLTVNLGGSGDTLNWGSAGFVPNGSALLFSSSSADSTVSFLNPINFGSLMRTVQVANGTAIVDAELIGALTGGGGLAKTGTGALRLSGANTYSGATVVNAGTLIVNGSIAPGSGLTLSSSAAVGGIGTIARVISGSGTIAPGNSAGILTVDQLNPSANMNFNFEFTSFGAPDYTQPGASLNDVLRITNAMPFTVALGLTNTVNLYLSGVTLTVGATNWFRGGFYTDVSSAFDASITGASYQWYYNNVLQGVPVVVRTVDEDETDTQFGGINGYVTEFGILGQTLMVVPEPTTLLLLLSGFVTVWFARRRQRQKT